MEEDLFKRIFDLRDILQRQIQSVQRLPIAGHIRQRLEHRHYIARLMVFNQMHFWKCAADLLHLTPASPFQYRTIQQSGQRQQQMVDIPHRHSKSYASIFMMRTAKDTPYIYLYCLMRATGVTLNQEAVPSRQACFFDDHITTLNQQRQCSNASPSKIKKTCRFTVCRFDPAKCQLVNRLLPIREVKLGVKGQNPYHV